MDIILTQTRVLLVEDDADLRDALVEYLEFNGCRVTAVPNGMAFYQAIAKSNTYNVAIIDLGLPDQPGHVLAEYVRKNTLMSIIIITANDSFENRIETYKTGADLLLCKPLDSRELVAAVAAMNLRYLERLDNQPAEVSIFNAVWQFDHARRQLTSPLGVVIELNVNESILFKLFCTAGCNTVDRRQLLECIYSRNDESSHRALDNMIRRLRQKISEGHDFTSPIITAYGIGYSFREPLQILP